MHIDAIDFQYIALEAQKNGKDPFEAIEKTWLLAGKDNHYFEHYWHKHLETIVEHNESLPERFKKPQNVTATYHGHDLYLPVRDIFRLSWQNIVAYDDHYGDNAEYMTVSEVEKSRKKNFVLSYFKSPQREFPHLKIPHKEVFFESTLTPKWNNFYAIYFTITGLHGLHIIGGMIVLAWFGFNSKKIYDKDPEWLANRVEVGGLFWHFVDLVWIFVFPIFYLM